MAKLSTVMINRLLVEMRTFNAKFYIECDGETFKNFDPHEARAPTPSIEHQNGTRQSHAYIREQMGDNERGKEYLVEVPAEVPLGLARKALQNHCYRVWGAGVSIIEQYEDLHAFRIMGRVEA